MKILILGGSGMLGHRLALNLSKKHTTYITVRTNQNPIPEFPDRYVVRGVDGLITEQITEVIVSHKPDVVINCIGLIKQANNTNPLPSIMLNTLLPHQIALICRAANIRMIHISTDCVFSGNKGNYTHTDPSDATDLYGRSKYLGEVYYPDCITLRTSIIGMELKNHLGLIDWFLSQSGTIKGYRNAIYTGLTTDELSRVICDYVIPSKMYGLYHVSSDPISKYDLLERAKYAFKKDIVILPDDEFKCDRSLDSSTFRQLTGYSPPSWDTMINDMASVASFYNRNI